MEEVTAGMWRSINGEVRKGYLKRAIEFTGDANLYGEWMLNVLTAWPNSCEHNLTADNMNRQAWIGHAACCLAIGCPEDITREAWHLLTQKQQDDANAAADAAIEKWERTYETTEEGNQYLLFEGMACQREN